MSRIYIRFNTDNLRDKTAPPWRVIVDGELHLVDNFVVEGVRMVGGATVEDGVDKYNVYVEGTADIVDSVALIGP